MKQSKKLLSIFLAMLMLLGTVSVVANAAQVKPLKENISYDSIDNAVLTPEQVANTVLDVLDRDVMPGLGKLSIPVLGDLDLTSIDNALSSVYKLLGNGLIGFVAVSVSDIKKLTNNKGYLNVSRSDGDLEAVYGLLNFLTCNDVSQVVSEIVYGVGTSDGISLGGILNSALGGTLEDINAIVMNLDQFAAEMVYDMLIHGSYGYDLDAEEAKAANNGKLPTGVDNLDGIINTAVKNLLTKPQKYTWEPTGATDPETGEPITTKVWDDSSYILDASKVEGMDLTLTGNSIFSVIDKVIQIAYEDFGTVVLNHDVKKIFMEAMGVDFVRVTDAQEEATIKADSDFVKWVLDEYKPAEPTTEQKAQIATVKNYFCNAQMWKVGDTWYFRDYVTTDVIDPATGEPKVDEYGNVETTKVHRYFRAETYGADDLFDLVNWDYYLTGETMNFNTLINKNGSLIGSLNDLLNIFLNQALNLEGLNKILAANGENTISRVDDIWAPGGLDMFNENLMSLAGILLKNFTFMFFGRNPAYVDLNTLQATADFKATIDGFVNAGDREGLIAYMLLPFLGDALPQLVYSTDMFESGKQIEQVAVLLVREFLSDLTPQINYDDQIFVDASLATGRKFQAKTSEQWINLLLNMGLDLAAVYLDNIANFNVDLDTLGKLHAIADGSNGKIQRWEVILEEIVDWAVAYISDDTSGKEYSVLYGCEPTALGSARCVTGYNSDDNKITGFEAGNYKGNAFDIVSTVLNKLLPLGLLCNVSSEAHALDVKMVFDRLINVIDDFDLEVLLTTFGRNNRGDNLLGATNVVKQVLGVVNKLITCLFGRELFSTNYEGTDYTVSLNKAVEDLSLQIVIQNLLRGLGSRKVDLLRSALPVVAVFADDWGSEQALRSPELSIERVEPTEYGTLKKTYSLYNGSRGLWRGYMDSNGKRDQDEQYVYVITGITSAQNLGIAGYTSGELHKGDNKSITLTGNVGKEGLADMITISYQIKDEDDNLMDKGKIYTKSYYVYFNWAPEDMHAEGTDKGDVSMIASKTFDVTSNNLLADVKEFIAQQEGVARNSNAADSSKEIEFKNTGTATQGAFTLNTRSSKVGEGENWNFNPFTFTEGSFDEAKIKTNGAQYEFSHTFYREYTPFLQSKVTLGWKSNRYTAIIFYNGQQKAELEAYVDEQIDLNRQAGDYTNADAYGKYLGALAAAMCSAYNPLWNYGLDLDFAKLKTNLENAIATLEQYKKPADSGSGDTVKSLIADLDNTLDATMSSLGGKDYRTHMLYRWHRFQSAKKDAERAIDLQAQIDAGATTQKFEQGSTPVYKLKSAVSGDTYEAYILALLKDLQGEELEAATEEYSRLIKDYAGYSTLDIGQLKNLVTRMSDRLLPREGGVVNTYLVKEINAAKAEIGTTNTAGYSTRSWKAYSEALTYAESVKNSASQDTMFNAKYQLQVARNNLRLATAEADYTELQRLIDQAEYAINHLDQYKTETPAQKADIGAVLAALGYQPTSDGVTTKVFYDGAYDIINKSIDAHDQEDIDDVADRLKAALSKLEFKTYDASNDGVETSTVITSEKDENGEYITESLKTKLIASEQNVTAVKSLLKETSGYTVAISLDDKYTSKDSQKYGFVGTGATITILKDVGNGVTAPVATIKVVVDGDVTGDGVVDVLDCAIAELAKNAHTELVGVYHTAGNADGVDGISQEDFSAIVNKAVS